MLRNQITELYYLTPIANLSSISTRGLLSKQRAAKIRSTVSIANQDVQNRREAKAVPRGRPLHEYVNFYINVRNPMMYCQQGTMDTVCVVRVSSDVLDLPGVVITDRNAAADMARFTGSPAGLAYVDFDITFARYWTHADYILQRDHKQRMCAEVLVPDQVKVEHLIGCYVRGPQAASAVKQQSHLPTSINGNLFFS